MEIFMRKNSGRKTFCKAKKQTGTALSFSEIKIYHFQSFEVLVEKNEY